MSQIVNFQIKDTESLNFSLKVTNPDGTGIDLTGFELNMRIRVDNADGEIQAVLSTNAINDPSIRILIADQTDQDMLGLATVLMPQADVSSELGEGDFCYALVASSSATGVSDEWFTGEIEVSRGI